jgi:type VI secretion system protein VasG
MAFAYVSDWPVVIEIATEALATKTKDLQIRIGNRLQENNRDVFSYDDSLVIKIARRCTEVESGARNVDHILTRTLLPEISQEFLARMAVGKVITKVHVSVHSECGFRYEVA